MNRIKFSLVFLYFFIKSNILVFILLLASLIAYKYAGSFDDKIVDKKVLSEFNGIQDDLNFVVYSDNGYSIIKYEDGMLVENGILKYERYNDINILIWIIFGVLIIINGIYIITNFDDLFDMVDTTLIYFIESDMEDNLIYYTIFDRLIGTSKESIRSNNILYKFNIKGLKDVELCPKFYTRRKKRDDNLEKILK